MHPSVTYTPCATSLKEQTGNITSFAHFEEGNLIYENFNDAESGHKSDEDSIMPLILREEEIYAMNYGNDSDDYPISTEMLEDIRD